jgi:hypothetical protein
VANLKSIPDESWISIDVGKAILGNGTYSFLLTGRGFDLASFYSRESNRNPPRLVVDGNVTGDVTAPSTPSGLTATPTSSGSVRLVWKAASDDKGLAGYDVFRDGKLVTSVGAVTSFQDAFLAANTTYSYQVRARDRSGNRSALSPVRSVTTPPLTRVLTISPEADARVEEARPTSNFGGSTELRSSGASGARVQSFLRFRVTGVPGTVYRATLRLFVLTSPGAGTVDGPSLYRAADSWSETTITWKNRPARVGSRLGDLNAVSEGVWVEYNVTATVVGNGVYSFMLASGSGDAIRLYSREGATKPQLLIAAFPDGNISSASVPSVPVTATSTATPSPAPTPTASPTPSATSTESPTAAPTLPIADGFENGLAAWSEVDGLSIQSDHVANGQNAAEATSQGTEQEPGQAAYARRLFGEPRRDLYVGVQINVLSQVAQAVDLLTFEGENAESILTVMVDGSGRLAFRNDRTNEVVRLDRLMPGKWHHLQVHIETRTDRLVELWLGGVLVARERMDLPDAPVTGVRLGETRHDRSYHVLFDDFAIDSQCVSTCTDPSPTPAPSSTPDAPPVPTATAETEVTLPTPTDTPPEPTATTVPEPTATSEPTAEPTATPTPTQAPEISEEESTSPEDVPTP